MNKLIRINRYCNDTMTKYGIHLNIFNEADLIIYFNNNKNEILIKDMIREKEYTFSFYISRGYFEELTIHSLFKELFLKMHITAGLRQQLEEDGVFEFYDTLFESLVKLFETIKKIQLKTIYFNIYFTFILYDFKYNYFLFQDELFIENVYQFVEFYDKINKMSYNTQLFIPKEKHSIEEMIFYLYECHEEEQNDFSINNQSVVSKLHDNLIELLYLIA